MYGGCGGDDDCVWRCDRDNKSYFLQNLDLRWLIVFPFFLHVWWYGELLVFVCLFLSQTFVIIS